MAKKKSSHAAAAAANGNGNGHGLDHAAPAPGMAEAYATEEKRDSSPERDRKAEQLKTLNTMLLREAVERRRRRGRRAPGAPRRRPGLPQARRIQSRS